MEANLIRLLTRLKRNDRGAMNELFEQFYTPLCRFGCSYVTLSEAEELVADVFIGIWRARNTIEITSSLRAYLYASVRYACYRSVSTHKISTVSLDDLEDVIEVIGSSRADDDMIFQETHALVSSVVRQLPPRCRQVFIMNRFDGLSYREIADVMIISEKTVEHQVGKALQVMRASLNMREHNTQLMKS